jgi:hypothetical protein
MFYAPARRGDRSRSSWPTRRQRTLGACRISAESQVIWQRCSAKFGRPAGLCADCCIHAEPSFQAAGCDEPSASCQWEPPRPSGDARALRAWTNAMQHLKSFSPPHPICSSFRHEGAEYSGDHYVAEYSGNWAGQVAPDSFYGNTHFSSTTSEWNQPKVGNNSKYTN